VRDVILFDNKVLEIVTKSPWYAVIIGWMPIIVYWAMESQLSSMETFGVMILGCALWTLIEYLTHRFLFHAEDHFLP
jgi:hypothetical protein